MFGYHYSSGSWLCSLVTTNSRDLDIISCGSLKLFPTLGGHNNTKTFEYTPHNLYPLLIQKWQAKHGKQWKLISILKYLTRTLSSYASFLNILKWICGEQLQPSLKVYNCRQSSNAQMCLCLCSFI
jgi:hypothetical protein